jgi:hypothetical protein
MPDGMSMIGHDIDISCNANKTGAINWAPTTHAMNYMVDMIIKYYAIFTKTGTRYLTRFTIDDTECKSKRDLSPWVGA